MQILDTLVDDFIEVNHFMDRYIKLNQQLEAVTVSYRLAWTVSLVYLSPFYP
jgi:hypothetical protein